MNIFMGGLGFAGGAAARQLSQQGHRVWGLNRSGTFPVEDIHVLAGDVLQPDSLRSLRDLPPMDLLVMALSGTGYRDPGVYRSVYVDGPGRLADALRWRGDRRVWFLGSTGVYGESQGEWVDEETPAHPLHPAGQVQLDAETALRDVADHRCVLRLSGLYGPGRSRMVRQARRMRPYLKPEVWANQIHRDDVARVLVHLASGEGEPPPLLLVSDHAPALRQEVFDWIRERLGCPEGDLDEAHPERAGRDRGNKRVRNRRLRETGVELHYPDFRAGYAGLLAD